MKNISIDVKISKNIPPKQFDYVENDIKHPKQVYNFIGKIFCKAISHLSVEKLISEQRESLESVFLQKLVFVKGQRISVQL